MYLFCYFNGPATPKIYTDCHTLSLHDALPSGCGHTPHPACGSPATYGDRNLREGSMGPLRPAAAADGLSCAGARCACGSRLQKRRSDEHTSELQSLMRISYAVFCLKKKKHA